MHFHDIRDLPQDKFRLKALPSALVGVIPYMVAIVKTFENSCHMAALKNDGRIDRNEAQQLKKINTACEKFIHRLQKIK